MLVKVWLNVLVKGCCKKVFNNWATGRPLDEGVPEATATGAVVGSAAGGVFSAARGRGDIREDVEDQATAAHVENIQNAETVDDAIQAAEAATAKDDTLLDQLNEMAGVPEATDGAVDEVGSEGLDKAPVSGEGDQQAGSVDAGILRDKDEPLPAGAETDGADGVEGVAEPGVPVSGKETKPADVITMEKVKGGGLNIAGKGAREALKDAGVKFVPRKGGAAVVSKSNEAAARKVISPLTEEGQQKAAERSKKAQERTAKRLEPNPDADSLVDFVAKWGGYRDPGGNAKILEGVKSNVFGAGNLLNEKGADLSDITEAAREAGYDITDNDKDFATTLAGDPVFTAAGNDRIAEKAQADDAAQAKQYEEQDEAELGEQGEYLSVDNFTKEEYIDYVSTMADENDTIAMFEDSDGSMYVGGAKSAAITEADLERIDRETLEADTGAADSVRQPDTTAAVSGEKGAQEKPESDVAGQPDVRLQKKSERVTEDRKSKIAERKALHESLSKLTKKGGLTAAEAEEYKEINTKIAGISYELSKPATAEHFKATADMTTISPEANAIAYNDKMESRPVYDAIIDDAWEVYEMELGRTKQ